MGIALCEREKRVCIFEVGKEVDGEYSPFKLCVHKMQIISCLRMNAECKQGRVESPWSPGTPGSSRWLLLGEAGAPTWLPAFLFQSLWKLIVRSWESRSCRLEVYTAYAREALQTFQLYQLGAFASPSWKKKKSPLEFSEMSQACTASPVLCCSVAACTVTFVFLLECSFSRELGLPLTFQTFIWLILGVFAFFCEY